MIKKVTILSVAAIFILSLSSLLAQPSPSMVGTSDDDRAVIYNSGPCIDRAPNGTVMCIWGAAENHSNSVLWTTYDDVFGTWNPAQVLDEGTPTHSTPALVADENNHFHATWSKNYRIYYAQFDGVSWSTPIEVQKDTLSGNKNSIVVDSEGTIWITWNTYYQGDDENEYRFIAHSTDNGANWSDPDTLDSDVVPGIVTSRYAVTHLAAGPDGKLAVTFREKDTDVSARYQLYYREYDGSTWLPVETFTHFFHDSIDCYQASVDFDENGKRHVAFYTDENDFTSPDMGQIFYTSKEDGGDWTEPVRITNDPDGIADYPQIVIAPNGAMYVIYFQGDASGVRNVFVVTSADGGETWSDPIQLSTSDTDVILRSPNIGRHIHPAGVGGTSFEGGADAFWMEEDASVTDGYSLWYARVPWVNTTDVKMSENLGQLPETHQLFQNYPNPFNASTMIKFQLQENSNVQLKIFDTLGKEVATIIDRKMESGVHSVNFDASNLSSGVYFYKLITQNFVSTNKMILMK